MSKYYNAHTIWITMMLLTISTYSMGKFGFSGVNVVLVLLLTTALKSTFIIREYMGLRGVSLLWRGIMYGWLSIITASIAITYIISVLMTQ